MGVVSSNVCQILSLVNTHLGETEISFMKNNWVEKVMRIEIYYKSSANSTWKYRRNVIFRIFLNIIDFSRTYLSNRVDNKGSH